MKTSCVSFLVHNCLKTLHRVLRCFTVQGQLKGVSDMGIYDTYGDVQLKVGDVFMADYQIGDKVEISDGIYFAPEGVVVIYRGLFVAEISPDAVFDKWGGIIEIDVDLRNPVAKAVRQIVEQKGVSDG